MSTGESLPGRSRIFISYRREDTEHAVGRLAEDLRKHFPHDQVFQDIASIDPGADFVEALQHGLDTCAAVLVVIGPRWLTVTDRQGRRRLDLPNDWVRHEVAESLQRPDIRVFPVVLDARMPDADELPESLRALTRRQAFPLTVRHWPNDVAHIVEYLSKVPTIPTAVSPVVGIPLGTGSHDSNGDRKRTKVFGGRFSHHMLRGAVLGLLLIVVGWALIRGISEWRFQNVLEDGALALKRADLETARTIEMNIRELRPDDSRTSAYSIALAEAERRAREELERKQADAQRDAAEKVRQELERKRAEARPLEQDPLRQIQFGKLYVSTKPGAVSGTRKLSVNTTIWNDAALPVRVKIRISAGHYEPCDDKAESYTHEKYAEYTDVIPARGSKHASFEIEGITGSCGNVRMEDSWVLAGTAKGDKYKSSVVKAEWVRQ